MVNSDEIEGKVPDKLFMNQAEYSKHRGCTRAYVSKLKKQGRLIFNEQKLVDVIATDRKLNAEADPAKQISITSPVPLSDTSVQSQHDEFRDHKIKFEAARARNAELDLAEREGVLFDIEDIRHALAELAILNLQKQEAAAVAGSAQVYESASKMTLTEFTKFLKGWQRGLAAQTSSGIESLANGEQAD